MKRFVSVFAAVCLIALSISGCSLFASEKEMNPTPSAPASEEGLPGLPIVSEPLTLSYWITYPDILKKYGARSYDSSVSFKELERETGIHIKFIHPSEDNAYNQYKLMIASRDLPDLVNNPEGGFPGGIEYAIESGIYVKLNDYIEKYAPNYYKCINQTEDRFRDAVTDNGYMAAFWQINEPEQGPWIGPAVRKDWLDKAGLDTPVSVSDWENMLRSFRDDIGANEPYKLNYSGVDPYSNILSAFGVGASFYKVGRFVHFGPAEEGYFEYLKLMNKWYDEGLINPSFFNKRDSSYYLGLPEGVGACTVIYTYLGEGAKYNQYIKEPEVRTVAVPYPVLAEGDKIHIRRYNPDIAKANTSVTSECKDVIDAVRWLDYGYSDDGAMILNYGAEDVTYQYVDGKPQFTDLILNNPDGLPPFDAMREMLSLQHPTRYFWQRELPLVSGDGIDAINNIWTEADADYVMPPVTLPAEVGSDFDKQMAQINSYVTEMTVKIIMGIESPDIYDEYIEKLDSLGLGKALSIQQAALDRYYER